MMKPLPLSDYPQKWEKIPSESDNLNFGDIPLQSISSNGPVRAQELDNERRPSEAEQVKILWWNWIAVTPHPICNIISIMLATSVLILLWLTLTVTEEREAERCLVKRNAVDTCPPLDPTLRLVKANVGAVASDEQRCSAVGSDVLKMDGNAVDAAVATTFCLGVVNPMASGIGGGCFIVIRMAHGSEEFINCREKAPAAASRNMFNENPALAKFGGLAVGVPGEVAGLHKAWQRHGKLKWKDLLAPAITLADRGFRVAPYLAAAIKESAEKILSHKGLASAFAPGGKLLVTGDMCFRKNLAETLRSIQVLGPDAFYQGPVAKAIVKDVAAQGGILTTADLAAYQAEVSKPLVANAMGLTLLSAPPPSSGGAVISLILNILAGFELPLTASGLLGTHRMIEAFKHAFALRMALGDPTFVNCTAIVEDMLSDDFAARLRGRISDNATFTPEYYNATWRQLSDHGTSHINVVDSDRSAVALTSTINLGFGSLLLSEQTGVLLNNEMDDFSIPDKNNSFGLAPAPTNFIAPGKRPLSSMAPTIVLQGGRLRAVLGGSGGPFIITATVQVFLNLFARGFDSLQAVQAPRLHHQLIPNKIYCEANHTLVGGVTVSTPPQVMDSLARRGHVIDPYPYGGVVQLIEHDLETPVANTGASASSNPGNHTLFGQLTAVSDWRKDGVPSGW